MQKSKCTNRIKITHQWKQKIEKQECVQKIWNPFMFSCVFLELLGYQPRVSISCWIENILRATGWKLKKKPITSEIGTVRCRYCNCTIFGGKYRSSMCQRVSTICFVIPRNIDSFALALHCINSKQSFLLFWSLRSQTEVERMNMFYCCSLNGNNERPK